MKDEILDSVLDKMSPMFSSNQFTKEARKSGISNNLVVNGICLKYLFSNCERHNSSKRLWVKRNVTVPRIQINNNNQKPESIVPRYFAFLSELKEMVQRDSEYPISKIIERYGISKDIYWALRDAGIIENVGSRKGRVQDKKWIAGEPDMELAKKLIETFNGRQQTEGNQRGVADHKSKILEEISLLRKEILEVKSYLSKLESYWK